MDGILLIAVRRIIIEVGIMTLIGVEVMGMEDTMAIIIITTIIMGIIHIILNTHQIIRLQEM